VDAASTSPSIPRSTLLAALSSPIATVRDPRPSPATMNSDDRDRLLRHLDDQARYLAALTRYAREHPDDPEVLVRCRDEVFTIRETLDTLPVPHALADNAQWRRVAHALAPARLARTSRANGGRRPLRASTPPRPLSRLVQGDGAASIGCVLLRMPQPTASAGWVARGRSGFVHSDSAPTTVRDVPPPLIPETRSRRVVCPGHPDRPRRAIRTDVHASRSDPCRRAARLLTGALPYAAPTRLDLPRTRPSSLRAARRSPLVRARRAGPRTARYRLARGRNR
jgi:hypothetical protein